jgi:hypothetical protein
MVWDEQHRKECAVVIPFVTTTGLKPRRLAEDGAPRCTGAWMRPVIDAHALHEMTEAATTDTEARKHEADTEWHDEGGSRLCIPPDTSGSATEWLGWDKGSWADDDWSMTVLGEAEMLSRLPKWRAAAEEGMVLLVSSDCRSFDPFNPSKRCSYSWHVWGMFPWKALDSEDHAEWEKYLEFPHL